MKLRNKKPALVLINVQKAFLNEEPWGGHKNNKDAELICGKILAKWRELKLPVFHVRHSSANPDSELYKTKVGFEFNENVTPLNDETVITKEGYSAFIGTNLKEQLDNLQIDTLVVVGITANHCVSTTVRMACDYGYENYLISDATAAFSEVGLNGETINSQTIYLTTLATLNSGFATVWDFEKLMSEI